MKQSTVSIRRYTFMYILNEMGRQSKETEQTYIRITQFTIQRIKRKIEQLNESFACERKIYWSQCLAKIDHRYITLIYNQLNPLQRRRTYLLTKYLKKCLVHIDYLQCQ